MANTATPRGSRFNGIFWDGVNSRILLYNRGTLLATLDQTATSPVFAATSVPDATGDTSTYAETAITAALTALSNMTVMTDSTTT